MPDPHQRLAALFQGRTDAFGAVHGESVKYELREAQWKDHVYYGGSVGVYPLLDNGTVHWGCVDIDDGYDISLVVARNLHRAYAQLGLTSWIERTKGKGYHVWLLCSDWVPAVQMRAVQILACTLVGYTPREINPKQVELADGQLGNYVNVPYAKQHADFGKRVVLCEGACGTPCNEVMGLDCFLLLAESTLNAPADIERVSRLYRAPQPPKTVVIEGNADGLDLHTLSPLTRKVFVEGPLPNEHTGHIDRSAGLQKLAHLCASDGLTPGATLALVTDLDTRLRKYVGRADAEKQLTRIVERAFGG